MNERARATITAIVVAAIVAAAWAALAQATVPGKNGPIVYRHFKSLFVVNADGTGERKLTTPGRREDSQPDWSPDGSRIAFQRCTNDCNVWTIAASGTGLRRLGPAGDDRAEPAWAPNGRQIAYTRRWGRRQGDLFERAEIYVMNTTGGATRPIERGGVQAPGLEVAQHRQPGLGRLAIPGGEGEELLVAVAEGPDDHQQAGLLLLEAGLHVHAVGPDVHQLAVGEITCVPALVLDLPGGLEPRDRRGREWGARAEQTAQRELEVAKRQAVQVQLRQQRSQAPWCGGRRAAGSCSRSAPPGRGGVAGEA